ncbi:hypothetical protein Mgra_00002922 [Meloidogyne graminicola]|uniref:Uncharacterized protein n=1 Tax=Meloidogyne graminicola TaxID=189291 RepID=A0A8S9ZVD6_9BILA|nr:hypothetical protein Mgra_00002922 [Meloidogyne graminicola]
MIIIMNMKVMDFHIKEYFIIMELIINIVLLFLNFFLVVLVYYLMVQNKNLDLH